MSVAGAVIIRTAEQEPARPQRADCACGGILRFWSSHTGYSMQECTRCGVRPMQAHYEPPVVIPPELLGPEPLETVTRICAHCGRSFETVKGSRRYCGTICAQAAAIIRKRVGGKPGAKLSTNPICPKCGTKRRRKFHGDGRPCGWRCDPCERAWHIAWKARRNAS